MSLPVEYEEQDHRRQSHEAQGAAGEAEGRGGAEGGGVEEEEGAQHAQQQAWHGQRGTAGHGAGPGGACSAGVEVWVGGWGGVWVGWAGGAVVRQRSTAASVAIHSRAQREAAHARCACHCACRACLRHLAARAASCGGCAFAGLAPVPPRVPAAESPNSNQPLGLATATMVVPKGEMGVAQEELHQEGRGSSVRYP